MCRGAPAPADRSLSTHRRSPHRDLQQAGCGRSAHGLSYSRLARGACAWSTERVLGRGTARGPGLRLGKRSSNMALELYMLGLVVHDMGTSLEFYRDSVLPSPRGATARRTSRSRWGAGSLLLDSRPARWDPHTPGRATQGARRQQALSHCPRVLLEDTRRRRRKVCRALPDLATRASAPIRVPHRMYFALDQPILTAIPSCSRAT